MSLERKTLNGFIHARLWYMRQLVTFGELWKDIDTTGAGSVCVVAQSCNLLWLSSIVLECNVDVSFLHGKEFGSGTAN
jgi:hypothetical protein